MKKFLSGLFALVLAFGAVAFTNVDKAPKTNYYWFQLDPPTGNQIPQATIPPSVATDPYSCLSGVSFCSRGYGNYEVVPGSSPVKYRGMTGTEGPTHKKN